MLRQLNDKRQVTIPAPLAKRAGVGSRSWVDLTEKNGVVTIRPVHVELQSATPLTLSRKDWQAFNRKVREELRRGKGVRYPDEHTFLRDLKQRIGS